MKEYLSYSELDLWYRDKPEHYRRYVEGIFPEPTEQMKLGTMIHKVMEDPKYDWLKELRENYPHIEIAPIRKAIDKLMAKRDKDGAEHEAKYRAELGDIKLFCVFDAFDKSERLLTDYKTSFRAKAWTPSRADYDKQFSLYALAHWLNTHSFFKTVTVRSIDLSKGNVETIETARDRMSIDFISKWIEIGVYDMKQAGVWEKRLSKEERDLLKAGTLDL